MENKTTELVFIIDRSGSMSGLESDTIGGFNSMLKEQQSVDGRALVTTILFDDEYELLHNRVDIRNVKPLTEKDYTARGSTALLDAIGRTIHNIRKSQKESSEKDRPEKVIFFIITDGQENSSRRYTFQMIQERISHYRKKHGWEFMFFGANMDAIAEAAKMGIDADRAHSYRSDHVGTASVYSAMSAMSTAFRLGRRINHHHADGSQNVKDALRNLKRAVKGLKESADEMSSEFSGLIDTAKANGGKIPDVNEILRQVLSENNKEDK